MNRVIHTQTHSQNDVDAADDVDGDVPPMKKSNDVHEGQNHRQKYHQRNANVGQEDDDDGEYCCQCQSNISPQFVSDNFIRFPCGINLN